MPTVRGTSRVFKNDHKYKISLSTYAEQTEEWQTGTYFAEHEKILFRIGYVNLSQTAQAPHLCVDLPPQFIYNSGSPKIQIADRPIEEVADGDELLASGLAFDCPAGQSFNLFFSANLNNDRLSRQAQSFRVNVQSQVKGVAMQHFAHLTVIAKAYRR